MTKKKDRESGQVENIVSCTAKLLCYTDNGKLVSEVEFFGESKEQKVYGHPGQAMHRIREIRKSLGCN